MRASIHITVVVTVLAGIACGGDDAADASVDGGGSVDAGALDARAPTDTGPTLDAGMPDAGPPLDPALFDCTSPGATDETMLPERASPIPIACALDPSCRTPQVTAHRGAGGPLGRIAPEDTLAAYRAGIAIGAEYVETDPRPTLDGVIVNMHDTTVNRTTDGTGTVSEMTFDQVRALHIVTTLPGDYSCERVPTLEEILRTCVGRVVVLVDANKTDRVDLLVEAIHAADAVEWSIFDTSSLDKIDQALAMDASLHFQIRPGSVEEIEPQLDHYSPTLPVIVELGLGDVPDGAPIVHARGTRAFTDVFGADALFNIVGDTSGYTDALTAGADILETDRPDVLIEVLRARGDR